MLRTWTPDRHVTVTCPSCGHVADVAVEEVQTRVSRWTPVTHLFRHFRCQKCGEKGRAKVNVMWALGWG